MDFQVRVNRTKAHAPRKLAREREFCLALVERGLTNRQA